MLALCRMMYRGRGRSNLHSSCPHNTRPAMVRMRSAAAGAVACSSQTPGVAAGSFEGWVTAEDLAAKAGKIRMDAFLAARLPETSRSRLKDCIRDGKVHVNSARQIKAAYALRLGDAVTCELPTPRVSSASPEDIPLDIVHEDDSVIVVNKPAGMVVHPSPGHEGGTLVNAILFHCGLPAISGDHAAHSLAALADIDAPAEEDASDTSPDDDVETDDGVVDATSLGPNNAVLRPGIVHRLDKGTTGLMVICRDERAMTHVGEQFRDRTVERLYWSITAGVPAQREGTVRTNIVRHPSDRKRMAVCPFEGHKGKTAISTYRVLETLADGTAALVQWKLHTGRTHQIRVHAQHMGHSLLGDDDYGGVGPALAKVCRGCANRERALRDAMSVFGRPALHAKTLGFRHPETDEHLAFGSELAEDFQAFRVALEALPPIERSSG